MAQTRFRSNEQIRLTPIRLIDQDKKMLGVVPTAEALRMAREAGMDLVEIVPNERPPVCRIMDFGKHKYQQSKKQKQRHHEQKTKEVRIRPKTDEHDRKIKLNRAKRFLEAGDRVQFTMLFRGRERFRQDLGLQQFQEIVQDLQDIAKVDRAARAMGRRMTMVLAPLKPTSGGGAKPKPQKKQAQPEKPKAAPPEASTPPAAPQPERSPSPAPQADEDKAPA